MIESLICYIIQGQSSGESLGDPSSEVGMSSSSDAWSLSAQFDMLHLLDEIPWTCGCWVLAPFITGHSWCHQLEPRTGVPLCDHWGHWGVNDILTGSSPFKGWISANSHHSSISIQFIDIHSMCSPITWWYNMLLYVTLRPFHSTIARLFRVPTCAMLPSDAGVPRRVLVLWSSGCRRSTLGEQSQIVQYLFHPVPRKTWNV